MNAATPQPSNRRLGAKLALAAVLMFGFGYLLAPLYDVFCRLTGLNGKTGRIAIEQTLTGEVDRNRWVTVEFIASTGGTLPWEFRPLVDRVRVHPGEVAQAAYFARNVSNVTIVGQAVPSVAPGKAAPYFNKTECFCFTQQPLASGEGREMPVRFVVDPKLPDGINTVTLSYTFFAAPGSGTKLAGAQTRN